MECFIEGMNAGERASALIYSQWELGTSDTVRTLFQSFPRPESFGHDMRTSLFRTDKVSGCVDHRGLFVEQSGHKRFHLVLVDGQLSGRFLSHQRKLLPDGMYLLHDHPVPRSEFSTDLNKQLWIEYTGHVNDGVTFWLCDGDATTLVINGGRLYGDCIWVLQVGGNRHLHSLYGIRARDTNWNDTVYTRTENNRWSLETVVEPCREETSPVEFK
jgi:hypothetical protein